MVKINTLTGNKRMSTQQLLEEIYEHINSGEREFFIEATGQHDIGGPLWTNNGDKLKFVVNNPGQRVGCMAMEGTEIIIEGSAPADVGWINTGATIVVKGDGGDTTAHCAASGKIYVGGRAGTRSGSLMKYDPAYPQPELWVLKNIGSFSFEFMSGGIAVVCGYDSDEFESVLGNRACVGMVNGVVYVRGKFGGVSDEVIIQDLTDSDIELLKNGMPIFLNYIERNDLNGLLTNWGEWKKISVEKEKLLKKGNKINIKEFHQKDWLEGGIFGDVYPDDGKIVGMITTGEDRLKMPIWQNSVFSAPCQNRCPIGVPTQERFNLLRQGKVDEALRLALEFSPFTASVCGHVCPGFCMEDCSRRNIDVPLTINELGILSLRIDDLRVRDNTGKKIAIIGSGPGGLSAAWQLRLRGHIVDVYEADSKAGGKMTQVIPRKRLPEEILLKEITRVQSLGVNIFTNKPVTKELFEKLRKDYDAVVISAGAHLAKVVPWKGHEKLIHGITFLKEINKGLFPKIGEKVLVIGAGNAGMDVATGAFDLGAKDVTVIDIQKPAAFDEEIESVKSKGGKIVYPVFTKEINDKGLLAEDGRFFEADTIIISIGEKPILDFLSDDIKVEKGSILVDEVGRTSVQNVYALGDAIKLGVIADAINTGREVAMAIHNHFNGRDYKPVKKPLMIPFEKLKKEYFKPLKKDDLPDIKTEFSRCISCGTCRDCSFCLEICPEFAIFRIEKENGRFEYISKDELCIGCGFCEGVCPCGIWQMVENVNTVVYERGGGIE